MSTTRSLSPLTRALLLGVLTGSRSATPLAVLALNQSAPEARGGWQAWRLFRSRPGRLALVAAGAGELVGDKLPSTPSRVAPGPLVGRALAGAVVGLAVADQGRGGHSRHSRHSRRRATGAVLGAVGALVGSGLFYLGRKTLVEKTGLPDLAIALVEDAVTITSAVAVVRSS